MRIVVRDDVGVPSHAKIWVCLRILGVVLEVLQHLLWDGCCTLWHRYSRSSGDWGHGTTGRSTVGSRLLLEAVLGAWVVLVVAAVGA